MPLKPRQIFISAHIALLLWSILNIVRIIFGTDFMDKAEFVRQGEKNTGSLMCQRASLQ